MKKRPKETCHIDYGMGYLKYAKDEFNYFHEHLSTIYFITKISNARNVLEIGGGPSTVAFSQALRELGFTRVLYSIDINPNAWNKVNKDLPANTVKIAIDSLDYGTDRDYEIIFIDGDHSQEHVAAEIDRFLSHLKLGGYIIFHDITNPKWGAGIKKAISNSELLSPDYEHYDWLHCNGLGVFKKVR